MNSEIVSRNLIFTVINKRNYYVNVKFTEKCMKNVEDRTRLGRSKYQIIIKCLTISIDKLKHYVTNLVHEGNLARAAQRYPPCSQILNYASLYIQSWDAN